MIKKIIYSFFLLINMAVVYAQVTPENAITPVNSKLHIRNIIIKGNKTTKTYIIEREMQVKKGDSINAAQLNSELKQAKIYIYNTNLFTEVTVKPNIINAFDIDLQVEVKERWYIFPVPQFQLIDRNLNDWIKTFGASLSRVNYGLKFVHYNFSGRKDPLRLYFLNGYSRNFSFSYTAPYSNTALTEGFTVGAGYTQNREISYKTNYNNKVLFYPADSAQKAKGDFVRNSFNAAVSYSMRKGYHKTRFFSANYSYLKVNDSIVLPKYNPNYFNAATSGMGFIDLAYTFQYLDLDKVAYPLSGLAGSYSIMKRGFGFTGGVNTFSLLASIGKYSDWGKNWYANINLSANIKLPFQQAYINQRSLGYGETYLRGLEYYVIDGVATALAKTTLRYKLASFKIPIPFKIKSIPNIPVTIFAKSFADLGYSFNKNEFKASLNNKLLYTGGFGIDILSLYDINLRLEYSFNQLGEKGLFLHTQGGF